MRLRRLWNSDLKPDGLDAALSELRAKQPPPTLWLFGKTQSGKSSIVKFLTGADDAAIGSGFRPCTLTSRKYPFPTAEAPLVTFLDTRGVDEPSYDPAADIASFDQEAHLIMVTVRIADFATATVHDSLARIRQVNPHRPVLLVLTSLHETLEGHPSYGMWQPKQAKLLAEQKDRFAGLIDAVVLIDLTRPEEGFAEPNYGGEQLKAALLDMLPNVYRHSMTRMSEGLALLKDLHQHDAAPIIVAYATLAASTAAVPVPFVNLVTLPAIQARMVYQLARLYGQEMTTARLLEIAGSLGIGLLASQAIREVAKLIPGVGSAVAATMAWASTYALGRAICLYFEEIHDGHVPRPELLKALYVEQFAIAKERWKAERP